MSNSIYSFLYKIEFLQDIISHFIASFSPAVIHNISKYFAIKKAFYLSSLEEIEGDYFEFGVFTGSSFCHAIRCAKTNEIFDNKLISMHFYGYDSFEGFGSLVESDKHRIYRDNNFKSNYEKVNKRIKSITNESRFSLMKGYFEETLHACESKLKSRIIFIDSDTYKSADLALKYIKFTLQEGTIIILDDFYAYTGSQEKGVAGAFYDFVKRENIKHRHISSYGMGGVIVIISKI